MPPRRTDPIRARGQIIASGLRAGVEYGVIILAVVLAWQMVVALMADRAPVNIAVMLAPRSPVALVRAADGELEARRYDNAAELAGSALRIAPFDAHALSIAGRAQAARGDIDAADQTLTLAGNWSLRHDPTHAWLIDRRLRQGDYASAFAHAETLVRRRAPAEPQLFEMFTLTAAQPVGLSVLLQGLSASPPWRSRYLTFLNARKGVDTDVLLAALALNLQKSAAPLTDPELRFLYWRWLEAGRLPALQDLRSRLNRPVLTSSVWNGGFNSGEGIHPFTWSVATDSGFSVQIGDTGDARRGGGLHVDYDGLAGGVIAGQLVFLRSGPAVLRVQQLVSGDLGDSRLEWRLRCFEGSVIPIDWSEPGPADATGWREISGRFSVPAAGCTAQHLQLTAVPGDRRRSISGWFDDVRIRQDTPDTTS